jgi:multimeric flavodoxin WrbA
MRAVPLDASPPASDSCRQGADALRRALVDTGHEVEHFGLSELPMAPCRGCFACWTATPGRCPFPDASEIVDRAVIASDMAVWYSPIRFGAWSWIAKKALDRMICLVSPHFDSTALTRHKTRYLHFPALWGVGWLPGPDPEQTQIFKRLVEHNAYNMRAPAWEATVVHGDRPWSAQRETCLNALAVLTRTAGAVS